jgi:Tfp pilus assembly protein PilZ
MERRKHFRYPVDIRVEFIVEGYDYKAWIKNISQGWILIETKELFAIGQAISMTYSSPNFGEENRVGTIIRMSEQGIGVKFRES